MAKRPTLTVTAAVEAFEVERRTLQRLLAAGQLDGARKDSRGRWEIPIETLHAAGFTARQTWLSVATKSSTGRDTVATDTPKTASNQSKTSATDDATGRDIDATDLRLHVAQLEAQLNAERQLREAAERNADDLRAAMRMIEASTNAPSATPSKPRWWQRK